MFQNNVLLFDFERVELFCRDNIDLYDNRRVTTIEEFEFHLTIANTFLQILILQSFHQI